MDCYHEANKSYSHLFPFLYTPKGKLCSHTELWTCAFNKLKSKSQNCWEASSGVKALWGVREKVVRRRIDWGQAVNLNCAVTLYSKENYSLTCLWNISTYTNCTWMLWNSARNWDFQWNWAVKWVKSGFRFLKRPTFHEHFSHLSLFLFITEHPKIICKLAVLLRNGISSVKILELHRNAQSPVVLIFACISKLKILHIIYFSSSVPPQFSVARTRGYVAYPLASCLNLFKSFWRICV